MKIKFSKANLKLILFVSLIFLSINTKAQVFGCHVLAGSTERIYFNYDPSKNTPGYTGWVVITGTPSFNNYNPITECLIDNGFGGCKVYNSLGINIYTGVEGTIYMYPCPIDDYIPALLILIVGFVYFRLRNLSLA